MPEQLAIDLTIHQAIRSKEVNPHRLNANSKINVINTCDTNLFEGHKLLIWLWRVIRATRNSQH